MSTILEHIANTRRQCEANTSPEHRYRNGDKSPLLRMARTLETMLTRHPELHEEVAAVWSDCMHYWPLPEPEPIEDFVVGLGDGGEA